MSRTTLFHLKSYIKFKIQTISYNLATIEYSVKLTVTS